MAVTVILSLDRFSNPATADTYADGKAVQVVDGHLQVMATVDGYSEIVGIYAPGKWVSVSRDDQAAYTRL